MTFSLSGHAAHGSCLGADGRGRNLYRSRLFRDSDHVDRVIDRSRRYSGSTDGACCRHAASLPTKRRGPLIHRSRDKAEDVPGDTRDVRHVPRRAHQARGCRTRRSSIGTGSSSRYREGSPAVAGAPRRPDRRNAQRAPRCKAGAVVGSAGPDQPHHRNEVRHLGEREFDHLPMGVERCWQSAPDTDGYGAAPLQ